MWCRFTMWVMEISLRSSSLNTDTLILEPYRVLEFILLYVVKTCCWKEWFLDLQNTWLRCTYCRIRFPHMLDTVLYVNMYTEEWVSQRPLRLDVLGFDFHLLTYDLPQKCRINVLRSTNRSESAAIGSDWMPSNMQTKQKIILFHTFEVDSSGCFNNCVL